MTETELIKILIENSKEEKDGVFFPNEVTLKISELKHFNENTAKKLSKIPATIFSKNFGDGNGIYRKDDFKKSLIQYSIDEDYITFFPSILKAYLDEK